MEELKTSVQRVAPGWERALEAYLVESEALKLRFATQEDCRGWANLLDVGSRLRLSGLLEYQNVALWNDMNFRLGMAEAEMARLAPMEAKPVQVHLAGRRTLKVRFRPAADTKDFARLAHWRAQQQSVTFQHFLTSYLGFSLAVEEFKTSIQQVAPGWERPVEVYLVGSRSLKVRFATQEDGRGWANSLVVGSRLRVSGILEYRHDAFWNEIQDVEVRSEWRVMR